MINQIEHAQETTKINLKMINASLLTVVLIVFGSYLIGANSLAISGFTLSDYKVKLDELKRDNKNLEVRISTVKSYGHLSERIARLNLVNVGEIKYINGVNQVMAKR